MAGCWIEMKSDKDNDKYHFISKTVPKYYKTHEEVASTNIHNGSFIDEVIPHKLLFLPSSLVWILFMLKIDMASYLQAQLTIMGDTRLKRMGHLS